MASHGVYRAVGDRDGEEEEENGREDNDAPAMGTGGPLVYESHDLYELIDFLEGRTNTFERQ